MGTCLGTPARYNVHTLDDVCLMIVDKDNRQVRVVPIRKSIEVVTVNRTSQDGVVTKEPMLVVQEVAPHGAGNRRLPQQP